MIPRKLRSADVKSIVVHLCSLQGEDRRLRFGGTVSDDYITDYVEKSFLEGNSQWFGIDHINGHLVAACHASIYDGQAELGCSVDTEYRGHGFAQLMFDRAVTWLRTKGITTVFMHCLTENRVMRHIARKNEMTLDSAYGETDAEVHVAPATVMTAAADAYMDRISFYDMVYKQQMKVFNTLMGDRSNT